MQPTPTQMARAMQAAIAAGTPAAQAPGTRDDMWHAVLGGAIWGAASEVLMADGFDVDSAADATAELADIVHAFVLL